MGLETRVPRNAGGGTPMGPALSEHEANLVQLSRMEDGPQFQQELTRLGITRGEVEAYKASRAHIGTGDQFRHVGITPDVIAAEGPASAWDAHTRMGGVRNYALVTSHPDIVGATAPTPDMLAADRAGGAEDPEAWRNARHFPS